MREEKLVMPAKVEVFAISVPDDFGMAVLGCDIAVYDDSATVADFLLAMDAFAEQYLADCYGCDGCCRERAPLIAADIPALASLLPDSEFPAHAVCENFAAIDIYKNGAIDICFQRDTSGACTLLNKKEKICTHHQQRAFVCRSHFCLPRTEAISRLREEVVNAGENELARLLLAEERSGAKALTGKNLAELIDADDYPPTAQSGKTIYDAIALKQTLSKELWQQIKKEG